LCCFSRPSMSGPIPPIPTCLIPGDSSSPHRFGWSLRRCHQHGRSGSGCIRARHSPRCQPAWPGRSPGPAPRRRWPAPRQERAARVSCQNRIAPAAGSQQVTAAGPLVRRGHLRYNRPFRLKGSSRRMAETIRVGVAGAGWPGLAHARAYQATPGMKVVAVAELIPSRRKKLMDEFKVTRQFADALELIRDKEIDAISVCLPNELHAGVVNAALRAGKHVLCETPPAATLKEARAIDRTA